MDTNKHRVERGIELLDQVGPGEWEERLDLEILDVQSGCNCVLGQLYGSFVDGKYFLKLSEGDVVRCGFKAPDLEGLPWSAEPWWVREDEQYTALTTVWRAAILELRARWHQAQLTESEVRGDGK